MSHFKFDLVNATASANNKGTIEIPILLDEKIEYDHFCIQDILQRFDFVTYLIEENEVKKIESRFPTTENYCFFGNDANHSPPFSLFIPLDVQNKFEQIHLDKLRIHLDELADSSFIACKKRHEAHHENVKLAKLSPIDETLKRIKSLK